MLAAHAQALAALRIVLASGSPRRVELLRENLQLVPEVLPSRFSEDLDKSAFASPADYCAETARRKGVEVVARCCPPEPAGGRPQMVISADTVVVANGRILEKPSDEAHARNMLNELSGNYHDVVTAVALTIVPPKGSDRPPREHVFVETTRVKFSDLSDAAISAYAGTGEPLDKAGAYGIQGPGGAFVERVEGCYYTVVGLPINRFCRELVDFLGLPE